MVVQAVPGLKAIEVSDGSLVPGLGLALGMLHAEAVLHGPCRYLSAVGLQVLGAGRGYSVAQQTLAWSRTHVCYPWRGRAKPNWNFDMDI